MLSPLALGLAALEEAKAWFRWRLFAHLATLAVALVGVFVPHQLEYALVVLALASEGIAKYFHHQAVEWHGLGREAMRHALLGDSLGLGHAGDTGALRKHFSKRVEEKARQFEREKYYDSPLPPGPGRLRDNLAESACFSAHLYVAAYRRSFVRLVVLVALLVLAALLLLPFAALRGEEVTFTVARLIVLVLAFLPASEEIDNLLLWRAAAKQAADVEHRCRHLDVTGPADLAAQVELLAALGDYAAATSAAPPIPTVLYKEERQRLDEICAPQRHRPTAPQPAPPAAPNPKGP